MFPALGKKRLVAAAGAGLALTLLLAACGGGSSGGGQLVVRVGPASSAPGPAVNVPLAAPLAVIDPTVDTAAGNLVYQTLFQTLVFNSDPSGPIPSLAKSWTTSADGLTWTFKLDTTAKFSDGTAVTSADVVFTIQKEMVAGNPHAGTLTNVASVDASDPATVNFHLKAVNAAFLAIISAKYIVPATYYQSVGADGFSKAPIGSGPFKMDSQTGGGAVVSDSPTFTLVKKQQYSKITFTPVPSLQSQIAGLQSGTLDVVPNIVSNQVDQLKSDSSVEVKETNSSGGVSFIAFNTTTAPGNNIAFRKAVNEAIDRSAMVKTIMAGHASVATGLFTPSVLDYDTTRKAPTFDLTQAKKDLAASGYDGSAINMTYPTSVLVNADLVAQAVASFLSDLGVKVNLIPLDYTTFLQKWAAHAIDGMYIMQYQNGRDPDTIISSLYAGGSRVMFTDQAVTDAVALTRTTTGDARAKALASLETLVVNTDVYYAPLMVPNAIYGVKKGIPFTPNPFGAIYITYK